MIGAYTVIEDFAFIGQHVTSISGKVQKIGHNSYVGAGAVLTSEVKEQTVVFGIPAKEKKK
jgi:acetyltransferase-like isoleucine patch superfamily enzyme